RVLAVDARGNPLREQRGLNAEVESLYGSRSGRLLSRCAKAGAGDLSCSLQFDQYDWDPLGNLLARERRVAASYHYGSAYPKSRESFRYDSLNRLTRGGLGLYTAAHGGTAAFGALALVMAYDALGNVCRRSVNGSDLYLRQLGAAGCNGASAPQAPGGAA